MKWVPIGETHPIADPKTGRRPKFDDNGELRPTEFIPHAPLEDTEIGVDDEASGKTRRFVDATIEGLARRQQFSTIEAQNQENSFQAIVARTVKGVRRKSDQVELTDARREEFFEEFVSHQDRLPILWAIKDALELSDAKKKSLSSLFD